MIILAMLAGAMTADPIVVATHEPRSAADWENRASGRCGSTALEIVQPYGGVARVRVNGRDTEGATWSRLRGDLSNARASYRISFLCDDNGAMILLLYRGEASAEGIVDYRAGTATIRNGELDYHGLQRVDDATYWFR